MRALFIVAVSTRFASAEPPPPIRIEPVPTTPALPAVRSPGTGAPGVDDVWASGIVITPPDHAESAPWPHGMVMTPPDPRDDNVLEFGTRQLQRRAPSPEPTWSARLSRGLARGISGALELVKPAPSL